MNIIKRTFHSDPNIRYAREIKQGTIHVKKRAEMDKWRYVCWSLSVSVRQEKYTLGIFLTYSLLGAWMYMPKAGLFPQNISREALFYLSSILPLIVFLLVAAVFTIIALKNKLKRLSAWRIDIRRSNPAYIVAKRNNPKLIKYRRLIVKMLIALIIVTFAGAVTSLAWSFITSDA